MCQSVQWSVKAIPPSNNDGPHMLNKVNLDKKQNGSLLCNNFHGFLNHGIHAIINLSQEWSVCVCSSEKLKRRWSKLEQEFYLAPPILINQHPSHHTSPLWIYLSPLSPSHTHHHTHQCTFNLNKAVQHDEVWGISCLCNFEQLQFGVCLIHCLRLVVVGDEFNDLPSLPCDLLNPFSFFLNLF